MGRKTSAGLLMFRHDDDELEVFLVHPGGPYFARRDAGVWSVPKGEIERGDEEPLAVARREFAEETGRPVERCARSAELLPLGEIVQRNGKRVVVWAFEGDWPEGRPVRSNTCRLEWPRGSGRTIEIPEVDDGRFFPVGAARGKINPAQEALLDRLHGLLGDRTRPPGS